MTTAKRKWLLVFNCTSIGLANCLKLLTPDVEVEATDFGTFQRRFDEYRPRLAEFDLVVTAPHLISNESIDFSEAGAVQGVPPIYFDAYHPDLCYLRTQAGILKGPLGDYHSKIVTVAWLKGIPEEEVRALFSPERYQSFDYLDRWQSCKRELLRRFAKAGCPVDRYFSRWGARAPFMHSVNHPAIHALHDVACALLDTQGIGYQRTDLLPHDNLLNGPVWPVFDEIAEPLSVRGSYLFKLSAQYRCIGLEEFIAASYALLAPLDAAEVRCHRAQLESFEHVRAVL